MVADFLFFLLDVLHKQKTWCSKSGKEGKSPAWLNWDLLVKLEREKNVHRHFHGRRDSYHGRSTGTLLGCVGMGSGRPGLGKECKEE